MSSIKEIGNRIRQLRKEIKKSGEDFAKDLSVSLSSLSKYESGERTPDPMFFSKLREITDVNLNWLFRGEGKMFHLEEEKLDEREQLSKKIIDRAIEIDEMLKKIRKI